MQDRTMISVVIPTHNAEAHLAETMSSLVQAAVDGLVREVIVADAGSTDRTLDIADSAGAEVVKSEAGRGAQLKAGAARAKFPWLLFLNADTYLDGGWERDAALHIERVDSGRRRLSAASFRFRIDDEGVLSRLLEQMASMRAALLKLPSGEQGLLVARKLYDEAGGFSALPMMEDVDLARRVGRKRIVQLNSRVVTSSERYWRDGYASRMAGNQACLGLYLVGVPIGTIASLLRRPRTDIGEPVAERGLR